MPLGRGKYDDVTTFVRTATGAKAVIVIVLDGHSGSGFSIQSESPIHDVLPELLRNLADSIERDLLNNPNWRG